MLLLDIIGRQETVIMSWDAVARKKYYYANREKALGWAKGYRERNPEKVRDAARKWRKNNPEKLREYSRKYSDKKCIKIKYDEWNDTLRELGYADLINA